MENSVISIKDAFMNSFGTMFNNITGFLPKLIGALVILIIGYFIAKIFKNVLIKLLRAVKFNDLADKVGINGFMSKAGLKSDASGMLGKMGYWIVMLTTLILFFDSMELSQVSALLKDAVAFIPRILVGCILLIVGMYIADFLRDLAVAALKGGGFESPNLVGNIVYFGVMFLVVSMVLDQIGIGGDIVNTLVTSVLGGVSLATAIAFGLGGRDWARKQIGKVSKMD